MEILVNRKLRLWASRENGSDYQEGYAISMDWSLHLQVGVRLLVRELKVCSKVELTDFTNSHVVTELCEPAPFGYMYVLKSFNPSRRVGNDHFDAGTCRIRCRRIRDFPPTRSGRSKKFQVDA
jgi:hypothetical protein